MRRLFILGPALFLIASPPFAQMKAPAALNPAFEQLKSLTGEWVGAEGSGISVKVTYQVVSAGSVVMERIQPKGEPEMITMYTLEGDRILLTHYCSAGNQPVMQTAPVSAATGKLEFSFVRLGGAKSPEEGHMVGLSLDLASKDRLVQSWTYLDKGKAHTETFTLARKS